MPLDWWAMERFGLEKWFREMYNPMGVHGRCRVTKCSETPMMFSPCECGEREVVGWMSVDQNGQLIDIHMVGRTVRGCYAPRYCSKLGQMRRVERITDPDMHYDENYGRSAKLFKVCWCCSLN